MPTREDASAYAEEIKGAWAEFVTAYTNRQPIDKAVRKLESIIEPETILEIGIPRPFNRLTDCSKFPLCSCRAGECKEAPVLAVGNPQPQAAKGGCGKHQWMLCDHPECDRACRLVPSQVPGNGGDRG